MAGRALCALVAALCLVSGTASAQVAYGAARVPGIRHNPPPPKAEAPAPRPDPRGDSRHGAKPDRAGDRRPEPGEDLFRARPDTYVPRPNRHHRNLPWWVYDSRLGTGLYIGPPVADMYAPYAPPALVTRTQIRKPALTGYLRLDVQPRDADVYVDGVYAGTVEDFSTPQGRTIPAGRHRIEIRAPGFETVTFDVRITAAETSTFRRDLVSAAERPAPPAVRIVAAASKTLYVIPRCYAGDKPPSAAQLPPGCDVSAVRVLPN